MEDKILLEFAEFLIAFWKKHFRKILIAALIAGILAWMFPGWLVYYKPAFRGRVLDSETGEPIEGAVVVAQYYSHPIFTIHGGGAEIIRVRETLTDKNGEFHIIPYVRLINPNSTEFDTEFVIFKAGYGSYPNYQTSPHLIPEQELFFSENFGIRGEVKDWGKTEQVTFGVVRLPRLKTWEERRKSSAISISFPENKWSLLKKTLKKEDEWLYKNEGWER